MGRNDSRTATVDASVDNGAADDVLLSAMSKPLLTDHGRGKPVTLCGTNISMAELARRTGYSHGCVSRYIRGERPASQDALEAFAPVLRVSVKTLKKLIAQERASHDSE
jgi:hypothetical protein